ncbi:MAG: isochorismatase family cysteine hydrolase [Alphaproteobacteria bacterium]
MATAAERLNRPALLIVDMQNDFVRPGAPLEVADARVTIAAHQRLIACFREKLRPIVYTKFITTPYRSLLWNWSPECEPPTKCCWKNHKRRYQDFTEELEVTEIVPELKPHPKDMIVEKFGYGAFHGTALADMLHSHGVEALVVTGTVTQICVEETARQAFHHGFKTTMVSDAVSSFDPDLHAATLKNFEMKFGWVRTADEVIEDMSWSSRRPAR